MTARKASQEEHRNNEKNSMQSSALQSDIYELINIVTEIRLIVDRYSYAHTNYVFNLCIFYAFGSELAGVNSDNHSSRV